MSSEELRVRLENDNEKLLWEKVDEKGIAEAARQTGYSRSSIYNWRSKDLFLPLDFVKTFLEDPEISELKGEGKSKPVSRESFPVDASDELLTRISESVYVNREGVPFYRTNEYSLLQRFEELLSEIGDVPYTVYQREEYYDLRYPKFLHGILQGKSFERDLAAAIDESGKITEGKIVLEDRRLDLECFEDRLHSLRKREEIARLKGDSEELEKIIALQASKANELF